MRPGFGGAVTVYTATVGDMIALGADDKRSGSLTCYQHQDQMVPVVMVIGESRCIEYGDRVKKKRQGALSSCIHLLLLVY